jgi:TolB-like protein/DNA-binding winged helix-turn-helix (wHTH) protein/tetratricopeptide (TPR) repeat protein
VEGDFRLGEWLVRPRLGSVQSNGRIDRIEPRCMQVLVCLANHSGEVVSKEELIRSVWTDTFVTDEVLTRAISELRRTLSDDAKRPRLVETIPKIGYRIIAPVELVTPDPPVRKASSRKLITVLALLFVMGAGAILAFVAYGRFSRKQALAARVRSIAVLPLDNLSHDPEQEYFADGMTEALINNLSKVGALRVISRTSVMQYKTNRKSLPEIARDLRVDAIVEGSVQRSANRVRIAAQLIDGKTDAHLWAQSFDRDLSDVLVLESEVAQAVTSEIRITLTPADEARLPAPHVVSQKAHDAYLHGRYLWNTRTKEGLEQSIAFYHEAIQEDPQYALAYAGLADSYILLENNGEMPATNAYPEIRSAAMKAVAADPNLAEAHMILADAKETEWDWAGAEKEYKRALELNPGSARAHHWYAVLLGNLKRYDEAILEINRAVDLEPLSQRLYANQCQIYYLAGRFDEALLILNTSPILKRENPVARSISGKIHLKKADYRTAIPELRTNVELDRCAENLADLAYGYALAGRREEAVAILHELQQLGEREYIEPGWIAMIWLALGDKGKTLDLLQEDYRLHSSFLVSLGSDPVFEPLHSDGRFQDLLRRIGLPLN